MNNNTFFDTTGGFDQMTQAEMNRAALTGHPLTSIGYGYACSGQADPRHGYELIWADRRGMGNHGDAYLRGTTSHTKWLVWQGKRNRLMEEHGCTEEMATTILRAKSGTERTVVDLALRSCHDSAWKSYPGCGGGVGRWLGRTGFNCEELSAPRLDRVFAIASALALVI